MIIIDALLISFGIYTGVYVLYSYTLLVANLLIKDDVPQKNDPITRFCILIPAHNEEMYLNRLLDSCNKQNYPKTMYRCVVIADNCTDRTALIAKQSGATCLVRTDLSNIGKGHTLKWALEQYDFRSFDAVVVIDADSIAGPDLLRQLDISIAKGERIIQCYNGVANPSESWFTRLMNVSRTIGNEIMQPGKRKLGFTSYLMGNGMCFTVEILSKYGWNAFTVGEDWEYYARLVFEGEFVGFARDARVYHQESYNLKQATTQRIRWSSGRFAIIWKYGFNILGKGLRSGNIKLVDASLPLLLPNPSLGVNITILLTLLSYLKIYLEKKGYWILWAFIILLVGQILIYVIGAFYTKQKFTNLLAFLLAPVFLIWKMLIDLLSLLGMGRKDWIRTAREAGNSRDIRSNSKS